MSVRRIAELGVVCAALATACQEEDSGGGGGLTVLADAVAVTDAAVADAADLGPVGDASPEDLLARFCERSTRAICEWAFDCPAAAQGLTTRLDLGGNDVESCVAAVAPKCMDDVTDRQARGTLRFAPDAIESCVSGMARVPCLPSSLDEWVGDWHDRVESVCGSVAKGTAGSGEGCERDSDCETDNELCLEGACRFPEASDLTGQCNATGASLGQLNADESCPGGVCVQLGPNQNDHPGMCTLDCHTGTRCPSETYCLAVTGGVGQASYFCTKPCEEDDECDGLECVLVDPRSGRPERHCWAKPPE